MVATVHILNLPLMESIACRCGDPNFNTAHDISSGEIGISLTLPHPADMARISLYTDVDDHD